MVLLHSAHCFKEWGAGTMAGSVDETRGMQACSCSCPCQPGDQTEGQGHRATADLDVAPTRARLQVTTGSLALLASSLPVCCLPVVCSPTQTPDQLGGANLPPQSRVLSPHTGKLLSSPSVFSKPFLLVTMEFGTIALPCPLKVLCAGSPCFCPAVCLPLESPVGS